jgi:hypothetical protein
MSIAQKMKNKNLKSFRPPNQHYNRRLKLLSVDTVNTAIGCLHVNFNTPRCFRMPIALKTKTQLYANSVPSVAT